jgi:hypothetical protein
MVMVFKISFFDGKDCPWADRAKMRIIKADKNLKGLLLIIK